MPQELKNTTMQMKLSEDQVAELTAENFQLKRAINKLRILQKLKDATSRQLFTKKVEDSETAKRHASKELYGFFAAGMCGRRGCVTQCMQLRHYGRRGAEIRHA